VNQHVHPVSEMNCSKHLADALRALLPAVVAVKETPAWWKQWLGWM
jgi:hypothetical protein